MIKTLIYKADKDFVVVCVSGSREVNEVKLKGMLACDELRLASDAEVLDLTGVPVGFLGPFGLDEKLKTIFATKDDLKRFATKDDLKNYPTKDDLRFALAHQKDEILFAHARRAVRFHRQTFPVFCSRIGV